MYIKGLLFSAAVVLSTASAHATVNVTSVAANFSGAVGGSNTSFQNLDGIAGNEVFRWGTAATAGGNNSFSFSSAATPLTVSPNTQFSLGTFSYNNQATTGTTLTGLQLSLTSTISGLASPITFQFGLGVTETPNVAPCPFASTTPCSDRVTISALTGASTFISGGSTYTLVIDGFRDSNGNFSTDFLGNEGTTTTANVIGRFATPSVPEPASWAMMVGGFGLMGAAMRRRRDLTKVNFI